MAAPRGRGQFARAPRRKTKAELETVASLVESILDLGEAMEIEGRPWMRSRLIAERKACQGKLDRLQRHAKVTGSSARMGRHDICDARRSRCCATVEEMIRDASTTTSRGGMPFQSCCTRSGGGRLGRLWPRFPVS